MHSLFGTARGSNLGPFDLKLDTLTTTPPPYVVSILLSVMVELVLGRVSHVPTYKHANGPPDNLRLLFAGLPSCYGLVDCNNMQVLLPSF